MGSGGLGFRVWGFRVQGLGHRAVRLYGFGGCEGYGFRFRAFGGSQKAQHPLIKEYALNERVPYKGIYKGSL